MGKEVSIIIPCAGAGTRMKSYGPKPLLTINDEHLIVRQIRMLRAAFGSPEIIVVTGSGQEKVEKKIPSYLGIKTVHNEEYETNNVAYSIQLGLQEASYHKIVVVYGDLFFDFAAIQPFVHMNESAVLVDNQSQMMRRGEVGVNVVNGRACYFAYPLEKKWCQIAMLCGKELELLKHVANKKQDKRFGYELLNAIINLGGEFHSLCPPDMKIAEIDAYRDLKSAKALFGDTSVKPKPKKKNNRR